MGRGSGGALAEQADCLGGAGRGATHTQTCATTAWKSLARSLKGTRKGAWESSPQARPLPASVSCRPAAVPACSSSRHGRIRGESGDSRQGRDEGVSSIGALHGKPVHNFNCWPPQYQQQEEQHQLVRACLDLRLEAVGRQGVSLEGLCRGKGLAEVAVVQLAHQLACTGQAGRARQPQTQWRVRDRGDRWD